MNKSILLASVLAAALAPPALGFQCPSDMAAIDEALAASNVSEAEKAEVKAFRDKGETEHNAGDHSAAVASLAEALRMVRSE